MTAALGAALAVAAFNVAVGAWAGRKARASGGRFWWLQGLGFFVRAAVFFGAAHALWRLRRDARAVALFILAAAVLQLVGSVSLHLRQESRD